MKHKQSGNMILMLFGAIAVAGVLGTGYMATMKGPGRALSESSRENSIENNMLAATKLVVSGDAAQQDCDGDGTIEPMAFRTGSGPTGGGLVPLSSGAAKNDTWGKALGYCVWDHGKKSVSDNVTTCGGSGANRLQGGNVTTENVLAIVSAGKDGIFQTTCNAWVDANTDNIADTPLIVTTPGSDDIVKRDTIESLMSSGALAQLPTLPDAACIVGAEGTMRYENGVPQVCSGSPTPVWKEIGGASGSTGNFAPTTGVNPSSTQTSGTITTAGYFGSRTVTVDQGATLVVNSVDTGVSSYDVPVGATVAIKGTAAAGYLTLKTFTVKIGTVSKSWALTTRAATVAAFSVSPATSSNMNVTGPGSPAYGSSVQFTVTNTGETLSAAINAIGFSPATNFETTGTNLCTGNTLAPAATCTFYARPKATADGALSSTMTVSATSATSGTATLSGTASSFIIPSGEQVFTASGSFVVPASVTSVSAVCVGKGANGGAGTSSNDDGGRGGDVRYITSLAVTPGESLNIEVGGSSGTRLLRSATPLLVAANGSGRTGTEGTSSTIAGAIGGGNGGQGNSDLTGGAGGGAGGYSGNGGNGSSAAGVAGSGGGGGGGRGGATGGHGGGGGGVGIMGQGSNGAGSTVEGVGGGGGSAGINGGTETATAGGIGGAYGGGGGAGGDVGDTGGAGGPGACRIIWGAGRAYPSTNIADVGCTLDGQYVPNGSSHTFYSSPTHPSNCSSVSTQSRTCTNGVLSGSGTYAYASCSLAVSSLTLIGQTTGTTNSITWPAGIQAGDLAIIYNYIRQSSGGTAVTPSGFNNIQNSGYNASAEAGSTTSWKILDGSESAPLSGSIGSSATRWIMAVFRPDAPINSVVSTFVGQTTNWQNPAVLTYSINGTQGPLLLLSSSGSTGSITGKTSSPAQTALSTAAASFQASYYIYNQGQTAVDHTYDSGDSGDANINQASYLTIR